MMVPMATVERRQQGSGPVRYRVRWRDDAGRQRSKTFARRRDADQWRTKVEHDVLSGTYVDPTAGRVTLDTYRASWAAGQQWAPSTRQLHDDRWRDHVAPVIGARAIGSLRPSEMRQWIGGLTLGPTASAGLVATVSSVLNAALVDGVIARNPLSGVTRPKVVRRRVDIPTVDEVEALATAMPPEWVVMVALGAGLGLRAGEALGLTVDRVDFLGRSVLVDRQARRVRGRPIEHAATKTRASVRTLPLPDAVGLAVSAHVATEGTGRGGLVVHSTTGNFQSSQRLSDVMMVACDRAGIRRLRFHDLRHFYASALIAAGCSPKVVQSRLGHATITETMDTYGHLWPESEEQTRQAIDAVLRVASLWPGVASGE